MPTLDLDTIVTSQLDLYMPFDVIGRFEEAGIFYEPGRYRWML